MPCNASLHVNLAGERAVEAFPREIPLVKQPLTPNHIMLLFSELLHNKGILNISDQVRQAAAVAVAAAAIVY